MTIYFSVKSVAGSNKAPLRIISVGMMLPDGSDYYAENEEFNEEWVAHFAPESYMREFVVPSLSGPRKPLSEIAQELTRFCKWDHGNDRHEFWGYNCARDWVAICQLYGGDGLLPKDFPTRAYDLVQFANDNNVRLHDLPNIGRLGHARDDAAKIMLMHEIAKIRLGTRG